MKSIKTPGMTRRFESTNVHYGVNKDVEASCWKPTLKERLHILLGGNIMAVFYSDAIHPDTFYLKTSKQKEIK